MTKSSNYPYFDSCWWTCDCGLPLSKHDGGTQMGAFGRHLEDECERCGKLYGHAKLKKLPEVYLKVYDLPCG